MKHTRAEIPDRFQLVPADGTVRRPAIALFLAACVAIFGSTAAPAQTPACRQFAPGGQLPVLLNAKLAPRTTLLCNDDYAALASGLTHGALWSAEHPTADSLAAARATPRQGQFHPTTACHRPTRRRSPTTAGPATTAAT